MISVQEAINKFRRDGAVSTLLKAAFVAAAVLILTLHFFPQARIDPTLLLLLLGGGWVALWYRTMKGSRLAAESSSLIASGRIEQAEEQIEQSLRAFSMSRAITAPWLRADSRSADMPPLPMPTPEPYATQARASVNRSFAVGSSPSTLPSSPSRSSGAGPPA